MIIIGPSESEQVEVEAVAPAGGRDRPVEPKSASTWLFRFGGDERVKRSP